MTTLRHFLDESETTQEAFARALGKVDDEGKGKQSYVSMLLRRMDKGRPAPADICPKIEAATGGKISRHDLRPDVFGPKPKKRRAA